MRGHQHLEISKPQSRATKAAACVQKGEEREYDCACLTLQLQTPGYSSPNSPQRARSSYTSRNIECVLSGFFSILPCSPAHSTSRTDCSICTPTRGEEPGNSKARQYPAANYTPAAASWPALTAAHGPFSLYCLARNGPGNGSEAGWRRPRTGNSCVPRCVCGAQVPQSQFRQHRPQPRVPVSPSFPRIICCGHRSTVPICTSAESSAGTSCLRLAWPLGQRCTHVCRMSDACTVRQPLPRSKTSVPARKPKEDRNDRADPLRPLGLLPTWTTWLRSFLAPDHQLWVAWNGAFGA